MDLYEVIDQVTTLLQQRKKVAYRADVVSRLVWQP